MKNLIVIKDVLPAAYWQELTQLVAHPDFPWLYSEEISLTAKDNSFKQNPEIIGSSGFTNTLYTVSKPSVHWILLNR